MRNKLNFNGKVIDYGTNDGHVASLLLSNPNIDLYVADIQNNLPKSSSLNKSFIPIDIGTSKIDVKELFFDCATCIHVLEHVYRPQQVVEELHRVLKKGGRLYIETPNIRSIFFPTLSKNMTWNFFDDPTHIRPYTTASLSIMCKEAGFKVIKCGIYREWKYALSLPIAPVVSIILRDIRPLHYSLIHSVGWSSYCYCKKI
jgi:2-polyprenyl-3-methyl-5-hydroxy-6-metoxy-1,4-benzoquinol methylase